MSPFRHLRYLAFRGLALPSFSPGPRREIKEGETADLTAMEATLNGVIETRREADISKGWTRRRTKKTLPRRKIGWEEREARCNEMPLNQHEMI